MQIDLKIILPLLLLAVLLYFVICKGRQQANDFKIIARDLPLDGWPEAANDWRLLHLSDIHLRLGDKLTATLLPLIQEAKPDCIIITGDMLYPYKQGFAEAADFLRQVAAVSPTFVVPGNKDHLEKATRQPFEEWSAENLTVLVNEAVLHEISADTSVWIVGVDDPDTKCDNLSEALAGVPEDAVCILLAHSPDIILRKRIKRFAAIFCGHTHGGQISLPGGKAIFTNTSIAQRYASGLHPIGDGNTMLIVSRGVNATRLRIRLFCPPEMTLWKIQAKTGKNI